MSSFSRLEFSRAWNYCGCWLGEIMPFTSESKSPDLRGAQRVGRAFPEDTQGHVSLCAHTAAKRWSTPPPMAPKKRRAADRSPTRIKLELAAADFLHRYKLSISERHNAVQVLLKCLKTCCDHDYVQRVASIAKHHA